jgi:Putative Ig domain
MIRAAALLLGLVVVAPVHAAEVVWRSSVSGVLPSPAKAPTIPLPPDTPSGFSLSLAGGTSVPPGNTLDLRPVVSGASGSLSYLLFGRLPIGATFDARTGRIAGRAVEPGRYDVWVSATDSTGATVTAGVVVMVA